MTAARHPLRPAHLPQILALAMFIGVALAGAVVFGPAPVAAQADPAARAWNAPVEPFRIAGNLYYVGAADISSFLITTPAGHILLDGGFVETAPLIAANVQKLGFRLADVKILLNSHAHFDHAGGLARLQELTGARFIASAGDAPLLAAGGKGDFRWGDQAPFPPIRADRVIADGDTVSLGGTVLTAHLTPGHTKGCTTWTLTVVDEAGVRDDKGKSAAARKSFKVVFVGSTTINPGVRLVDRPSYPGIASDYATSFRVLKALPCDIFLGPHGSFFNLEEKARRLAAGRAGGAGSPGGTEGGGVNPFVDPEGYKGFVAKTERAYLDQIAAERVEATAGGKGGPAKPAKQAS
ncbi:MAG: subclass B3 metallo-beta-lactamase [Acidobacteriota bacterium]|nr:subclass B3 metallo-beta-lactamase [Acidobacteriota bacterium]